MQQDNQHKTGLKISTGNLDFDNSVSLFKNKDFSEKTNEIISLVIASKNEYLPAVVSKIKDAELSRAGVGTQISKIRRVLGDIEVRRIIALLIVDLQNSYNVVRPLSDFQIKTAVEAIISERWHLKIEQIARAFHFQKMNQTVKILDRIDVSIIIEVLNIYENEIIVPESSAYQIAHKEYIEPRSKPKGIDDSDGYKNALKEHLKTVLKPKEK